MKKTLLASCCALLSAALSGCSTRTVDLTSGGPIYKSTRFGSKESVKEIEYRAPDGSYLRLIGYTSDLAEGLSVVAYSAARGAVEGASGGAKPGASGFLGGIPAGTKLVQRGNAVFLAPVDDPSVPHPEIEVPEPPAVIPPSGSVPLPNFPNPNQPQVVWDGKRFLTNTVLPNLR